MRGPPDLSVTTSPTLNDAIDDVSNASRVAVGISIPVTKVVSCFNPLPQTANWRNYFKEFAKINNRI
jgi:hypothetical protein